MLLFKAFSYYKIDNFQAIAFNYLTCFFIGLTTVKRDILGGDFWQEPWFPFALMLGGVFIASFGLIALTTQKNGITVATIAGKTTMVIPVIAAFFMYGDAVTISKTAGIGLAIAAIFLTAVKDKQELAMEGNLTPSTQIKANETKSYSYLLLPLGVFLSGGLIETVINYVQVYYLQADSANAFSMFIFTTAAVIGFVIIGLQFLAGRRKFAFRHLLAGICIGIPNYGSIYFLIRALGSTGWESSVVFPINNIGVVLVTTLAAYLLFREKLSKINLLGVGSAVAA
ncbi:MAG: hypothetical protein ACPGVB_15335, partial [Chitinophagales bacterium]